MRWYHLVLPGLLSPFALLSCTDTGVSSVKVTEPVDADSATKGASADTVAPADDSAMDSMLDHDATIRYLADNFDQLPEKRIGVS